MKIKDLSQCARHIPLYDFTTFYASLDHSQGKKLPKEESKPIGIWGQRHKAYLKEHRIVTYITMLMEGKLNSYLADIDKQAQKMYLRLIDEMADKQGVTEQIKAENPMEWIGRMGNIQNCAREVVNSELIYV